MNDKIIDLIKLVLASDLPISTKNEVTRRYLLPPLGRTAAIVEDIDFEVGAVERPSAEEVEIENNPKLKESDKEFERLAGVKEESEEDE